MDEQIVQSVVDDCTRPAAHRMMTAGLRALYLCETEEQAVLRLLSRNRSASRYERARFAADVLAARVYASWHAERLGHLTWPHAVPAASRSRLRLSM